ncbi:MAG: pyruvate, phosphate dikinase [Candidatus Eisenbacteria bacterium]|nr:pyruvate, phosphate dikinase [Candidatus Eisenbacteria bacterium]
MKVVGTKLVYFFGELNVGDPGALRELLGGKGAGLTDMTAAGIPVPPGYTITTEVCRVFYENNGVLPEEFVHEEEENLRRLEEVMGKKLGDRNDPLLVSVRSGAKFSMPGMMDTVLNLGLNDGSVEGLARKVGSRRFAYDCYRRLIQMFGNVVLGIQKNVFEHEINAVKKAKRLKLDTELTTDDLVRLVDRFKAIVRRESGKEFPQDPREQLALARGAVFRSWMNERAVYYRKQNDIPDDIGTAVNVQAMVFGNTGEESATGVGFTRDPATGENTFYGEYLTNAQGEDVVSGVRTPKPISELKREMPEAYAQLRNITSRLERHYKDVQDFEFTIQEGKLYLLQTRTGKRTGLAALRIAVEMVEEGIITKRDALMRVEPEQLEQVLHRVFDRKTKAKSKVITRGLAASPGAAAGKVIFTADEASELGSSGEKVILVRNETVPDDIHGMDAAQGILTATGGMTSHAAVVARGMGKCCVAGAGSVVIDEKKGIFTVGDTVVREGDWISIDGVTGEVMLGEVPTADSEVIQVLSGRMDAAESEVHRKFETLMTWADEARRLGVRSNADIPRDAIVARKLGAEGIGLCRTEHMFFAKDRLPHVVRMIMAAPEAKQLERKVAAIEKELERAKGPKAGELRKEFRILKSKLADANKKYKGSLAKLLPFQKRDFKGLFKAMAGFPVTIRTLDPPLHEFLPKREELLLEIETLKRKKKQKLLKEKEELLKKVNELHEFNPMLGHRGCRLGITYPEITEMQARAIFEATAELTSQGYSITPEVMIPLVGHVNELREQKTIVEKVAEQVMKKTGTQFKYLVGTMIEIPRAAVTADEIAKEADFFSFGTNDLTQMTFGFSRDDSEKFVRDYLEKKILADDPFVTIDTKGVGKLVRMAVENGRRARKDLKIGICGEHGGEPRSVEFCHRSNLDYVSCSPYRVPVARLAGAQAALKEETGEVLKDK